MFLYGKNSVKERLSANPKSISKIFLKNSFSQPEIEKLIALNHIPIERLADLSRIKQEQGQNFQGIIAKIDNFEYIAFEDIISPANYTIIFLDRIYDPQNLGAIIRTVACFGRFAIVIPKFEACEVTETVLHIASGGENYVPVAMVTNLSQSIAIAKEYEYWIVGAVVDTDAQDINKVSLPFPLGLVLGSEGKGIRYGLQKHLDLKCYIPMSGANISFNVTIACAIFSYEIDRQRKITC
ncbi:MAG: RNA methyltransferase [Candidatus Stahlbacteria bacterium]|nr:RNA methyltransferase [Candidatus Stahlbacteria bacterium]